MPSAGHNASAAKCPTLVIPICPIFQRLVLLTSDNIQLNDVLHIVNFEDWSSELRNHRYHMKS